MRDTPLVTRRGVKICILLRRSIVEILADWKACAVRRACADGQIGSLNATQPGHIHTTHAVNHDREPTP